MQQKLMTWSNRIAYLFFLGIWGMAYLFYRQYVFLVLLWFMLLLCPVSVAAAWYLRKKILVSCRFDRAKSQKGTPITLRVSLDNPVWLASKNVMLQVVLENTFAMESQKRCLVMPLRAGKETTVTLETFGTSCGQLRCVITEYAISDWLGLVFFSVKPERLMAQVSILPRLLTVTADTERNGRGEGENEEVMTEKKGDDALEVISVREYEPGDRMQSIHWKLSAKAEEFFVREYGSSVNREMTLLLDLPKDALDEVIELFFSVGLLLCGKRQGYRVVFWEGGELCEEAVHAEEDLEAVLERVYEEKPLSFSLLEEYRKWNPVPVGAVLYFGKNGDVTQAGRAEAEICLRYREAVAAWL